MDDADAGTAEQSIDVNPPTFANVELTDAQRAEAILAWKVERRKKIWKESDKSSHVYYYMHRDLVKGVFYAEVAGGPKVKQEYCYTCKKCTTFHKPFRQLESKRHGATSGMNRHLKSHGITAETHFAYMHRVSTAIGGGDYTECDKWNSDSPPYSTLCPNRFGRSEATRRWVVLTRQPFSGVNEDSFQKMFLAHGVSGGCVYKDPITLRNHIMEEFKLRQDQLRTELQDNCISISLTLDMWTSPNNIPVLGIIGHWYTKDFEEREEVLDFVQVRGEHGGEQLAKIVQEMLRDLLLEHKLFAITGDNASNNNTLCVHLYKSLLR